MGRTPPTTKKKPTDRYMVPAVEQAARLLFCLAGSGTPYMTLPEICGCLNIHKSKAFSILETLQKFGLVRKNIDGKGYALGSGLVSLSRRVLDDLSPPRLAEPILKELARKTGSTAVLGLVSDDGVFIAAKHEGEGAIGVTMRIGHRLPLTFGAHGKAMAAVLAPEQLGRLLRKKDLYFYGTPEKLDRTRLEEELKESRVRGFAEDPGEVNRGMDVIAAPVLGPGDNPIGFIEILALFAADRVDKPGPLVAEAAKDLSRQLGAQVGA